MIEQSKNRGGSHPTQYDQRGFCAIGLDNPKSSINVGSVLRACGIYDVSLLATTGTRYTKAPTDTGKTWRQMPLVQVDDLHEIIPFNCVPVAVEISDIAKPLPEYKHPDNAFYVFGAEDNTLGNRVLSWCRDTVYIPGNGCMNLAATVNVVLYDRMAKQRTKDPD